MAATPETAADPARRRQQAPRPSPAEERPQHHAVLRVVVVRGLAADRVKIDLEARVAPHRQAEPPTTWPGSRCG